MTTRRIAVVATAALLGGLAGCSDDGEGAGQPRPPERLASAVTRLAEAGTGHFASTTAGSDEVASSTMEGDYQLSPPAVRLTVARRDPGVEARATEVVAIGREVWSREARPSQDAACWVRYDVTELFASGLLVRNGDTYVPAPVATAAFAAGVYATDADQVAGTAELRAVLAVADLALLPLLGLDRNPRQRVPITFTLDGGELAGWKVAVRDLVQQSRPLAESSASGDTRLNALSSAGGSISTRLTDLGDEVEIAAPSAAEVVDFVADADRLALQVAACAGQAP